MSINWNLVRASLVFHASLAVLKAQLARRGNNNRLLILPPVKECTDRKSEPELKGLVELADKCFEFLVRKTSQPCLFRSFVRGVVLRRSGIPVELNIGLRNMGSSSVYGHCWLTLDGKAYVEQEAVDQLYPVFMGKDRSGVSCWAGSVDTSNMHRTKREKL